MGARVEEPQLRRQTCERWMLADRTHTSDRLAGSHQGGIGGRICVDSSVGWVSVRVRLSRRWRLVPRRELVVWSSNSRCSPLPRPPPLENARRRCSNSRLMRQAERFGFGFTSGEVMPARSRAGVMSGLGCRGERAPLASAPAPRGVASAPPSCAFGLGASMGGKKSIGAADLRRKGIIRARKQTSFSEKQRRSRHLSSVNGATPASPT